MTGTQAGAETEAVAVDVLPLVETFGPTFQGEGPSAGTHASFIRLGGCNLTCYGCDTPYTWDAARFNLRDQITNVGVDEILARIPATGIVVITGGEPLLYQRRAAFLNLVDALAGRRVEIETNGTVLPSRDLVARDNLWFNCSPKLIGPMSLDPVDKRIVPGALVMFAELARYGRAVWKIVVATPADVRRAAELTDAFSVPRHRVWVMPEGVTPDQVLTHARACADTALQLGLSMTLRQHILLWPDVERGR